MIKELTQELQAQFKKGNLKPSQLKKSKSLNDLPANTPLTQPKRKSLEVLPASPSLKVQLTKAHDQISILELKLETSQRELEEKAQLEKELKEKLTQTQTALDNSLTARHQSLKDFQKEHSKRQAVEKELNQTLEEASEEISQNEQTVTSLRSQLFKGQQRIQELQRRIENNAYVPEDFNPSLTYFKYGVYALLAVWFLLMLRRNYD